MFPYPLNSSQPSGRRRRQNSLEAEFDICVVLRIAVNDRHLGSMHSNLCVYRFKMAAAPRLSRKSFALELGAHVFNLCKVLQVRKSGISIETRSYIHVHVFILISFQFLNLQGQKTGNKVKVVSVADLSVHSETFIMNVFQLTAGYCENRDVFVKSQTISMLSRMYLNGKPSSRQGNQIQGFGCPAFGIWTT